MGSIHLKSPAKINLSLRVGEYCETKKKHRIETLMLLIDLSDELHITPVEKKKIQITVDGEYAKGIPNNEENLIHKAIKRFFERRPFSEGFEILLTKNIPSGAGLGGGSSNAAEILKFLHDRYSVQLCPEEYVDLGSDIPFFLSGYPCAMVSGFGETVEEKNIAEFLGTSNSYQVEIQTFPEFHISTKWAYEQLKWQRENNLLVSQEHQTNDFESIILSRFFDIEKALQSIQKKGPACFGMTGTGSTVFGVFT